MGQPKTRNIRTSNKKYLAKYTGKVWNTREEASKDNTEYKTNVHYRYSLKGTNFNQNYPIIDYMIPYIPEKHIKLTNAGSATGAEFSTNLLDSIAVNAERADLDLETALGIVNKESTLNNPTHDMENRAQISRFDKEEVNKNKQAAKDAGYEYKNVIYHDSGLRPAVSSELVSFHYNPNPYNAAMAYAYRKAKNKQERDDMLIKGEAYADTQTKKILSQTKPMSVLEAAFRYYKSNPDKYNPGQKNYTQLVKQKGIELMSSPEIQAWLKSYKVSNSQH